MAFAATKRKRIGLHRKPVEQLKLTSMIDMFTILLIYLLKSYSPTETPSMDRQLQLPASISTKVPIETTIVQAARNMIIVDGRPIIMVDQEEDFKLYLLKVNKSGIPEHTADGSFIAEAVIDESQIYLPRLLDTLEAKRKHYEKVAKRLGNSFRGEITIMCDKKMPYKILKKVMATAGRAGFGDFKFAAFRLEEE
jgi:biopolymer transport protein ExbD